MTLPKITTHASEAEWLEARKGARIGSSEAPTCMGEGYEDPLVLWARKTGKFDDKIDSIRFRFGHYAEPFIHRETELELGVPLVDPGDFTIFEHHSDPRRFCTPDRLAARPGPGETARTVAAVAPNLAGLSIRSLFLNGSVLGGVNMKTVGTYARRYWPADRPARYAYLQAIYEMHILGIDQEWISALMGAGEDLAIYPVEPNPDVLGEILAAVDRMLECIQRDIPPEPGDSDQAKDALKLLYPEDDPTKAVLLPIDYADKITRWKELKEQIKELERERTGIENKLKARLGDALVGTVEGLPIGVSWKAQKGQKKLPLSEDTRKRLLELHPELADELTHQQGTNRVLRERNE